MSTSSLFAAKTHSAEAVCAESGRGASLSFVALASVLITLTYLMPISESWNRSAFEHYTNEDGFTTAANEGTLSHQIAFGSLGLFGILAMAWPGGKAIRIQGAVSRALYRLFGMVHGDVVVGG